MFRASGYQAAADEMIHIRETVSEVRSHVVAIDQPEIIVDAIRTVVETARDRDVPLCATPAAGGDYHPPRAMKLRSSFELQVAIGNGGTPGLQLASPRAKIVLRDANHFHRRNDRRNVLLEVDLGDDVLDRDVAPVVGR